jgi:hypothetical protein
MIVITQASTAAGAAITAVTGSSVIAWTKIASPASSR